ncbi:MAG: hypothetical protein KAR08_09915 [Candidatus Heimdallarchaeota archaeon]|nr:hypothetical protein [Candidatus Heimdallarchaeota archaeon]
MSRGKRKSDKDKSRKKPTNGRRKNAKKTTKSKKGFDEAAFCKKYPWVVAGSVKEVEPGTVIDGLTTHHPRICKVKCLETGKIRTIHVQDAFQTKYCAEVQKRKALERAAERRKKKTKKS